MFCLDVSLLDELLARGWSPILVEPRVRNVPNVRGLFEERVILVHDIKIDLREQSEAEWALESGYRAR
jgi:hypothetical protein